jgi:ParB-like nuclease domain
MTLEHHPIANIFPLLDGDNLQKLANDIKQEGLLQPVLLFEGKILDGRNRYCACRLAGVEPRFTEFEGTPEEAVHRVWSLNEPRRHLTSDQRACADAVKNKLLNSYRAVREAAKQRQREHGKTAPGRSKENTSDINTTSVQTPKNTRTREVRAKAAGTNAAYIAEADRLLEEEPEVFAQVQRGEKKLNGVRMKRIETAKANGHGRTKTTRASRKTRENIRAALVACAAEGRPLSIEEVSRITGYSVINLRNNVLFFLKNLVDWLYIDDVKPARYLFRIDQELKNTCDGSAIRPELGERSIYDFLAALRQEIDHRRKAANARRIDKKWNPDAVHTLELVETLDFIEDQLDKVSQPHHFSLKPNHQDSAPLKELANAN